MMTIQEAIKEAHECAKEHGFHNPSPPIPTLLALIITELSEAIEANRKKDFCGLDPSGYIFDPNLPIDEFRAFYESNVRDTFENELAGACIRIFDLAGLLNAVIENPQTQLLEPNIPGNIMEAMCQIGFAYIVIQNKCIKSDTIDFRLSCCLGIIFAIAKKLNIDLWAHIEMAMRFNRLREYKHGKKY